MDQINCLHGTLYFSWTNTAETETGKVKLTIKLITSLLVFPGQETKSDQVNLMLTLLTHFYKSRTLHKVLHFVSKSTAMQLAGFIYI